MKNLITITALILLSGCNVHYHVKKSLKHKEKAIQKGAVFNDSIEYKYKFKTDTILDTLTNETILYKYVVDSIPFVVTKSVYVPLSRQERLALKDSTKYALRTLKNKNKKSLDSLDYLLRIEKQKQRTARVETRQENKSNWWLLVLGFLLGVGTCLFLIWKFKRS